MWEPIIEDIFRFDDAKSPAYLIREVWALDCQNHGEAGIQNENVFVRSPERLSESNCVQLLVSGLISIIPHVVAIWDYAEAFAELYKSGLLGQLDPKKHKVVLCGHSVGSVAVYVLLMNHSSRTSD